MITKNIRDVAKEIIESLFGYYESKARSKRLKNMLFDAKVSFVLNCAKYDREFTNRYICAPGAQRHHHNHQFGLLEHSFELCMELCVMVDKRKHDLTPSEIAKIAYVHDFCKVDTYTINSDDTIFCDGSKYKKHALSSIEVAAQYGVELSKKEEVCVLAHMSRWANEDDRQAVASDPELMKAIFSYSREIGDVQDADMAACKQYDFTLAIIEAAKERKYGIC